MLKKIYTIIFLSGFLFGSFINPAIAQEPDLYEIYNTLYGTGLTSNTDLWDNYGYVCSDTGIPCTVVTEVIDCPTDYCNQPLEDEMLLETNGGVEASARFAGYTQRFGYHTDFCLGPICSDTGEPCAEDYDCPPNPGGTCDLILAKCDDVSNIPGDPCAEDYDCPPNPGGTCEPVLTELFNVTTPGYLYECSGIGGGSCEDPVGHSDCPEEETCDPIYGVSFLTGEGQEIIGLYADPSGSPPWFSRAAFNEQGNEDHMQSFRAPDFDPEEPEYFIGWEDQNLGDEDYNDLVLIIRHSEPSPTTECCEVSSDCDDGVACTDDSCVSCVCHYTPNDANCPDYLVYCNGNEICEDYGCTHSGDPCPPDYVCEAVDSSWTDGACVVDPPITYQFDFNGDEVWDTEWCAEMDETFDVDIWVDDYTSTTKVFGTLFFIEYGSNLKLNYAKCSGSGDSCTDTKNHTDCPVLETCETIKECSDDSDNPDDPCTVDGDCPNGTCEDVSYIYDSDHGGPWLPLFSFLEDEGGWVIFELHAAQFWGGGVPLPEGKVKIAKLQLERIAAGDSPLETDDGIIMDMSERFFIPDDAVATIKDCSYLDDQCIVGVCNPSTGECEEDLTVKNGDPCDDGDPCTVDDVCADGACAGSPKDCSHLDDQCNIGICDPGTGDCVQDPEPKNSDPCNDGDLCTEDDICIDGDCVGSLIPDCPCNTKIYRGGVCEESSPLDTIYNRPGRRGLAITCCEYEEFCVCSSCYPEATFTWTVTILPGSDPDFTLDDLVASEGTDDTFMLKVADPCTEHCPDELVELEVKVIDQFLNEDSVIVTIGRVALGLGSANAHPNTQTADIDLLLWNPENHVRALQTDICGCEMDDCEAYDTSDACDNTLCSQIGDETACDGDPDCQWKTVGGVPQCVNAFHCMWVGGDIGCVAQDNMVCTECIVDEDRTPEYICSTSEQANGCCMVTLYSTEPDDLIQQGSGAIARIKYDIGGDLTSKDCICLWLFERKVSDQFNEFLCACPKVGEICFRIYGDIYPQDCYECTSCGDGVVDLFDILEGIDITLGLQTATECQKLHGDVPLGMPPYCGNPAGVNPPNCEADEIIDIFDNLVIIDKALGRMNCCDYCMFGEIY